MAKKVNYKQIGKSYPYIIHVRELIEPCKRRWLQVVANDGCREATQYLNRCPTWTLTGEDGIGSKRIGLWAVPFPVYAMMTQRRAVGRRYTTQQTFFPEHTRTWIARKTAHAHLDQPPGGRGHSSELYQYSTIPFHHSIPPNTDTPYIIMHMRADKYTYIHVGYPPPCMWFPRDRATSASVN